MTFEPPNAVPYWSFPARTPACMINDKSKDIDSSLPYLSCKQLNHLSDSHA
jgi:hypothetical protein